MTATPMHEASGRSGLTAAEASEALAVLSANHGFTEPLQWLEYGKVLTLRRIPARPIPDCPDCGSPPDGVLGQYVYYSTLVHLRSCPACGLIWSDAAIDASVLAAHFEHAYKDEAYFENARAPVFQQLATLTATRVRRGGSVLDVGGGMGHLMGRLREMRGDIDATVLDISSRSIEYARSRFRLKGICGTVKDLDDARFDAVVCSDSLYYEEDIRACWEILSRITDTLIIRVPDKLRSIRVRQWLRLHSHGEKARLLQDNIPGFNPEHRYILSRGYLRRRLGGLGYRVRTLPARMLEPPGMVGRFVTLVSGVARPLGVSSAMVVVAERLARGAPSRSVDRG